MNVKQERDQYTNELGDLLITYLEALGVEHVFGVPGGAIEPLVNALARSERRGGPRNIVCRHETGAAFMAAGYHALSGRLGVCYATTGPGATNLVTGVASAYASNIPLLVITAQTALNTFGLGALQESSCTGTNTLAIFESITRYNTLVSHPDQLEHKLVAAVLTALGPTRGPAHLSVPVDVLKKRVSRQYLYPGLPQLLSSGASGSDGALEALSCLLTTCRKPVFVLGNEAATATGQILELAERLHVPLVTTPQGKGLVDPYHPLYRGVIGFAGHRTAVDTLRDPQVDLVVVIGSSLGEWASNGWDRVAMLNEKLVHVSSQECHFFGSPMARLHVRGDMVWIFQEVLRRLPAGCTNRVQVERAVNSGYNDPFPFSLDEASACDDDSVPLLPQRLMTELTRLFPKHVHYVVDSGNSLAWAVHYLHPPGPDGHNGVVRSGFFHGSFEFSSMGWAISYAVGAALALGGSTPVVCITGDGSYLMSSQEITVAVQQRLPVIYLIINDACYGMVKHGQRLTDAEPVGFELPTIDYAAMARAMGVEGYTIDTLDDLRALDIVDMCRKSGPTLLDVRIDPEANPPIGLRTRILKGEQ